MTFDVFLTFIGGGKRVRINFPPTYFWGQQHGLECIMMFQPTNVGLFRMKLIIRFWFRMVQEFQAKDLSPKGNLKAYALV